MACPLLLPFTIIVTRNGVEQESIGKILISSPIEFRSDLSKTVQ
jgi:hypothetical protein